jgi:SOUL heme-binding protein
MLSIALLFAPFASLMAYEEPAYSVVRTTENYEVRRYAPQLVAETDVVGEFDDAGNQAFRILAGYIFGDNESRTSIEMTAPVTQQRSEKIEMTAPVIMTGASGRFTYQFVMPARYSLATVPEPTDARVRLRELPARTLAVYRYSGGWSQERYNTFRDRLLAALSADGITPLGEPIFARYNSPFTLWFLRRNTAPFVM